ncbi:MAG: FeoB-associated Cys-rich membrane protein [Clostridiales bacterium]|nr:FeoB-associated Cys-rich membrane protein [Clostridiales bacterium]
MNWILENLGTIVISAVLLLIVALVVFTMIRNKKRGKSTCGCGCANCAAKDMCHKK